MHVDGHTVNMFDIISTQYDAYEEFMKAHGYQKKHIDLIPLFKENFKIMNK